MQASCAHLQSRQIPARGWHQSLLQQRSNEALLQDNYYQQQYWAAGSYKYTQAVFIIYKLRSHTLAFRNSFFKSSKVCTAVNCGNSLITLSGAWNKMPTSASANMVVSL